MNDLSTLSFSRWLKRLRAQHDLTQEALAELAYCSVQTIRFFESGKRRPSLEMAERLAEVLAIPEDQKTLFIRLARTSLNTADLNTSDEEGDNATPQATGNAAPPTAPAAQPAPSAAPAPRLPVPATLLVGRQPEAVRIQQLIVDEGSRLVTLVGPGGIGKTRLALHMAHTLDEHFANGAIFVPLVSISNSIELPSAIAGAMSKSLAGDSSSTAQLDKLLADQSMLLVLDNFEHLLALDGDAITALIDHILQHLPSISLLITSRERLRLGGESIFELGGLGVPTPEVNGAVANNDVAASDAVILFLQRARQVSPSFALTPANRAAIVRLCNLLRGMPLGIELAAAWMRTLTPDEIATEIGRSLDFLTLADRGVPARHRSLRAAFEHSWKLLSPEEQKAAARLSLFRGGFRRAGAQAVAGASLPSLAALIDKSLVQVVTETVEQEGGLRYEIHELLRQYLRDKLVEMGDEEAIARRHIDYFTAMAEEMEPHHHLPVSLHWVKKLRGEQGNLRAALEWSVTAHHAPELGLRMAGALGRFWYMCDAWAEGREWLRSALAAADDNTSSYYRAKALTQVGEMEKSMSDYAASQRGYEEALAIWRELHEEQHIAWTLFHLGTLAATLGDHAKSEQLLDESLAIYRRINEPRLVALVLIHIAGVVMQNGDYARCRQLLDEAVPIFRTQERTNIMGVALNFQGWAHIHLGDHLLAIENFKEAYTIGQSHANQQMMGWSLRNLGMAHLTLHNLTEAEQYLRSCLRMYQQISFKSGMIVAFEILAGVAAEQEEIEEAIRWLAVAEKLRQEIGLPRTVSEEDLYYSRARQLTTQAFSQPEWDAAWLAGTLLPVDEAITLATNGTV